MPLSNTGTAPSRTGPRQRQPLDPLSGNADGGGTARTRQSGIPKFQGKGVTGKSVAGTRKTAGPAAGGVRKPGAARAGGRVAAAAAGGAGRQVRSAVGERPSVSERAIENATARRTAGRAMIFTAKPDVERERRVKVVPRHSVEDAKREYDLAMKAIEDLRADQAKGAFQGEMVATQLAVLREKMAATEGAGSAIAIDLMRERVAELEGRLKERNEEFLEVRANHVEVKMGLEMKLVAAEAGKAKVDDEIKKIATTLAALETDKKFVQSIVSDKEAELTRLQASRTGHDAVVERLNADIAKHSDGRAKAEAEVVALGLRVRDMQAAVANAQAVAAEKEGEARKVQAEGAVAAAQLSSAQAALQAEKATVTSLQDSFATASAQHAADKAAAAEKLGALAAEGEEKVRALRAEGEEKVARVAAAMAREKKGADDLAGESAKKTAGLESEVERLQGELGDCLAELKVAQSDLAQFRTTISSLENAAMAMRSQMTAKEMTIATQIDFLAVKDAEIATLNTEKSGVLEENATLKDEAHESEEERRRLHNTLQELKGNIRVFCRVRPVIGGSAEDVAAAPGQAGTIYDVDGKSRQICVHAPVNESGSSSSSSRVGAGPKAFTFDRIFGPTSSQEDVFGEISQLVQSALDGYRVCIFAYGQTGSGKTHTIMGNDKEMGMIPRSVLQIFERAEKLKKDEWEFKFKASFLEIYNEEIGDLLCRQGGAGAKMKAGANGRGSGTSSKKKLAVTFDDRLKESNVEGLTVVDIPVADTVSRLMETAAKNRATAATLSNAESSRSHSVFRLYISGQNCVSGQTLKGVLNLVDLAGSERIKVSGVQGDRLKETKSINKSLSQLSVVIASLANKESFIPYRSSKLTHVLQDSLGGDSKTLMFVNVAPGQESYNESVCSLRFAEKVNACEIGVANRTTKISLDVE